MEYLDNMSIPELLELNEESLNIAEKEYNNHKKEMERIRHGR